MLCIISTEVKVAQLSLTLCGPMHYIVNGTLQARIPEWVAFPFCRNLPNPGTAPRSPALQADSLPAEPQGKPKNTGIGSLSLLQQIFPTQESNWGSPAPQADSSPGQRIKKQVNRPLTTVSRHSHMD